MPKTPTRRWTWVTRDWSQPHDDVILWLGKRKPKQSMYRNYYPRRPDRECLLMDIREFKAHFGYRPARGSCERVEFVAHREHDGHQ